MPTTPTERRADDADSLYIGLISGTSADGIDAAACRFDPAPRLIGALTHPWPDALHARLLELAQGEAWISLDELGRLDQEIGARFADAVDALLARIDVPASRVRAIGSHGQTMRHRPTGAHPFTLQLGNPWVIAERCGVDTVADFRRADMAAGGQGAPLMPAFHAAVFAAAGETRVVLNLGGIANVTILDADGSVHGFDTGPANGLMDAWCERHLGAPFDRDGRFAARGQRDAELAAHLLADAYFAQPPPKSTGREYFNLTWLDAHARSGALAPAHVQATLLAVTVETIAQAIKHHAEAAREVLVCGGGARNRYLMQCLTRALAPRRVRSTAACGVDADFMEAMGFAWLARQRLRREPGNVPGVTGAHGPRLLGTVHPAPPART